MAHDNVGDSISAEVKEMVRRELENVADKGKRRLVRATKDLMDEYYSFPEGRYYNRTGAFRNAYNTIESKYTRDIANATVVVGIAFDTPPQYSKHGLPLDEIYEMNLSGEHGGNGIRPSGGIIDNLEEKADKIASELGGHIQV